jgi:hypothetical protein
MSTPALPSPPRGEPPAKGPSGRPPGADQSAEAQFLPGRRKALTIGAVCKLLMREFPDISISKIRYLED